MISNIAVNARRIIADKGMKNCAVAERAGMSDKQFSNLLCGRRTIKESDVIALAEALNVTPNELFGYAAAGTNDIIA